ncbi:MAG: tape measure protein, partial [Taibaiella sp.]|nr:tape measure protein [Taibaiella sp.]
GVGLVAGLTTGIGASASLGMQSTATRTSMEVLAGEQKGAQLFTNLNKFAKDSIFGNEVYKNSQTLMGFGVAADNVMPRIKMLGDISMGNKQRFEMLTLAYAQTQAAGRLMGQDVLQMINAGFNPLQEISLMTGVSMAKLKERMEQGAISSDMVTKAFEHATKAGGRFFNMTEKIGNTPFGKWEALKGQTADVGRQIGEQMAPYIGAAIDKYARPLMDWMEETVVPRIAGFMEGIGGFVETMMPHVIQLGQTLSRVGTVVWEFITSESMANLSTSIIDLTSDIGNVLVPALEAVADVLEPLAYLLSPIVDMIGGIFNIIHSDANFTGAVAGYQHVRDEQMKMMEAYNKSITAGKSLFVDLNKLVDPRYPKPGTPYPALVSPYTPSTIGGASSPGAANGAGISQTDFNSLNDTNKTISASGPRMITVNFNRALVEGNTVNVNSVEEAEGFFDEKIKESVVRAFDAYLKK